ncbi:MAG: histidinol-phosphate transaminase [Janthinobacterium lividum]
MTGPQPRPEILGIDPYVGGESKAPGRNRVVKLSSNEGAFGPPPSAQAAYGAQSAGLHRYPDGSAGELRRAIGRRFGLDPERIVCGAGSDELIYLLCSCYGRPGGEIIMSRHGFSLYEIAGQAAGMTTVKAPERNLTADVDALLAAVSPRTRIVFLANPNNPTGSLLPHDEVRRLRAGLPPDVLLVLDAAYAEYVERRDYDPGVELVDAGDNTVMTRTFSKMFGLGGMRLGWCYAPPAITDVLNRVRSPFNISLAAQAAGIAALAEPGWVEAGQRHNAEQRAALTNALQDAGIKVWPSEGNFILADFGTPEAAAAADAALRARGVIVRAMNGYGLPHCLRISVGTAEECGIVADILAEHQAGHRAGQRLHA